MSNKPLGRCPTCGHGLDDDTRKRMGLRNGEVLNSLCPGRTGPSDVDHVLHNGKHKPDERIAWIEYKNGVPLGNGQSWLKDSLRGEWQERNDGRLLTMRYAVVQQYVRDPAQTLQPIVEWVFEGR